MNRTLRKLMIPGVGVVLATSGFAFMASNTVAASNAGQGEQAISGYDVSNVHYTYVDTDGDPDTDYIKSVTFTLDHHASRASAQINNDQTWVPYEDCGSNDGFTWLCSNSTTNAANLNYSPGGTGNDPSATALSVAAAS
jgi:hypothetical protein